MALFKVFGKAENDQGEFFTYMQEPYKNPDTGQEETREVRLKVRRMPVDMQLRFERKYGRQDMVADPSTGYKRPQHITSQDDNLAIAKDKACWAWTDCENVELIIGDEDAQVQWSKLLGEQVGIGQAVRLDGRLNDNIKRIIFAADFKIVGFIIEKVGELLRRQSEKEQGLSGN